MLAPFMISKIEYPSNLILGTMVHTFCIHVLTHVIFFVAFVGGDFLHFELRHSQVPGHRDGFLILGQIPLQEQLLRSFGN